MPKTDGFYKYLWWVTGTIFLFGCPWLMFEYGVLYYNLDMRSQFVTEVDNKELAQLKVNNLYLSQELTNLRKELEQAKTHCKCGDKCTCGCKEKK